MCIVRVWHQASSPNAHVELVGDFNGWTRPGIVLPNAREDGFRAHDLELAPGEHKYAFVDDGVWLTDDRVATTAFHEGREVTWIDVADCTRGRFEVVRVNAAAEVVVRYVPPSSADDVDVSSVRAVDASGAAVAGTRNAEGNLAFAVGDALGKRRFVIEGRDARGRAVSPAVATVWSGPDRSDLRDWIVYQVVVDRYRGDAGALLAPASPAGFAGGTLRGLRRAIESGALESMGVNAIWLSPLYTNPTRAYPGKDGRAYEGYHGYWATSAASIDARWGGEAELDQVVAAAHARNVRIIFDVVPNHAHEDHPYWREHPAWKNEAAQRCVCGTPGCDWAEHIEDCWFAPYLPDLDWRRDDVATQVTHDVMQWLERFDGDGLRVDAVPMMPRAASRRIAQALRTRFDHPGHKTLLLGENFTGPRGFGQLRYALGPQGFDSLFHFPLMWSLRRTLAEGEGSLAEIDEVWRTGEESWRGSGAIMSLIIGNHDVARFASVSAGTAAGDTWTPAPDSQDPLVFQKQLQALGVVLTMPGIPVLYYGDEVALGGREDPDNRRVMPDDSALSSAQRNLRGHMQKLGRLRACSDALRRGNYRLLDANPERLFFARETEGDAVLVEVLRKPATGFSLAGAPLGEYVDILSGARFTTDDTVLAKAENTIRVLVPSASPCAR